MAGSKIGLGWAALAAMALALGGCNKSDDGSTAAAAGEAGNAAAPGGSAKTIAAPAGQDWTETYSAGSGGGFVMGNPNAPVKLVEYGSLTCPHCADFEENGLPVLKRDYIATGLVNLEFRNFVRDSADLTATLIARCGGAQPFFKMTQGMYADQQNWFMKVVNMTAAQKAELQRLPQDQVLGRVAAISGLDQFAKQRGISDGKLKACLTDKGAMDALDAVNKKATDIGVQGTPSFLLNGELVDGAFNWQSLEPRLKAALAR